MTHKYLSWHYLVLNGRIRKRALNFPRRERQTVRNALQRAGVRYKEVCPLINQYYSGYRENRDKTITWFDFLCYKDGVFFVILFHPLTGMHGLKPYERRAFKGKKLLLENKGVPFMVLRRTETSQIVQIMITRLIQRERRRKNEMT